MTNLENEANRCLTCKSPLCLKGCPVLTPIPDIIKLYRQGKISEAGRILFENNPLSSICSVVCPSDADCKAFCILNHTGKPLEFPEIENFLASSFLDNFDVHIAQKNGFRVAVIGAGPAGISLSCWLLLDGFEVTLFDDNSEIGGILRYGIPEFRLSKTYLDKLIKNLFSLGLKFRPNTLVGPTLTLDDLFEDGYDAIFVGTGTWKPKKLKVKGESLGHVMYAVDFLKNPKSMRMGQNVYVVGAGNVAVDVARTIKKDGSNVTILNIGSEDQIVASKHEVENAKNEGVVFYHNTSVTNIVPHGLSVVEGILEETGFIPSGENRFLTADNIVIAIGQIARTNLAQTASDLKLNSKNLLEVQPNGHTTKRGVFAAGDVSTGGKTVVSAVAGAKIVYDSIKEYCLTIKKTPSI